MKTILVPTDFNELATSALRLAVEVARVTGAKILVLYVDTFSPPAEFTSGQTEAIVRSLAESRLAAESELLRYSREIVPLEIALETIVVEAFTVDGILRTAEERNVDLIVMGTHGRGGLARLVLGSVTEAVLARTPRPLLTTTRRGPAGELRSFVWADPSAAGEAAALLSAMQATPASDAGPADLLVACRKNRQAVRESEVPVLTVACDS